MSEHSPRAHAATPRHASARDGVGRPRALGRVPVLSRPAARCLPLLIGLTATAVADVFTPLASYEASETDLAVTRPAGDAGLTISIVEGGVGGAPAATDGNRVLKLTISNEADRKVEIRHDWTSTTYDLAGHEELLADVYVASAGAIPGLMGVWSPNWSPPGEWQPATGEPVATGVWKTVSFDLNDRSQTNLDYLWAIVFEDLAGASGVIYVDNLRFRAPGGPQTPQGVAANGYDGLNEIVWKPVSVQGLDGYNIYRSASADGPYTLVNATPHPHASYRDEVGPGAPLAFYQVTSVVDGLESSPSSFTFARYNGMTDEQMLDMVQHDTFQYFWDGGHPNCGLAREGINTGHPSDTVTIGGSGFGLMTIVVGAERGFVTRAEAADRVLLMLTFLGDGVQRYHGAWAHHYNGATGATIPFAGPQDNGGDLVETAFLVQGMLVARQYFDDPLDPVESEIRTRATQLWETVEWDWYRRFAGSDVLYWHWSPNFAWAMNLPIRGFNETQIVYLLAIASPTHPMPPSSYFNGWAGNAGYVNGNVYYGYTQWVGQPYGGPLFFTHYSNLGFDPRYKHDSFANYFDNHRNISRINRAHCIENPGDFEGYSPLVWGLTASRNPWGYLAHSPTSDNGTITPTAAISAIVYTPDESLAALRHLYDVYGAEIYGAYGFVDAFNLSADWADAGWLAIDQGTIATMIENYRTGLLWRLFMSNPEIAPMMASIGMVFDVDYDTDGDVSGADLMTFVDCLAGPDNPTPPPGVNPLQFDLADLDADGDTDLHDAAIAARLQNAD